MTKNLVLPEGISLLWKKMFPSRWAKWPNIVMWDYYALFKLIFNKLPFDYLGSHKTKERVHWSNCCQYWEYLSCISQYKWSNFSFYTIISCEFWWSSEPLYLINLYTLRRSPKERWRAVEMGRGKWVLGRQQNGVCHPTHLEIFLLGNHSVLFPVPLMFWLLSSD